jgi:hypothetical protein
MNRVEKKLVGCRTAVHRKFIDVQQAASLLIHGRHEGLRHQQAASLLYIFGGKNV